MPLVQCEFCPAKVRPDRLPEHVERVHPSHRSAIERARRDLKARERRGEISRPRAPLRLPWRYVAVGAAAVLVVLGIVYLAPYVPSNIGQHIHPTLRITINGQFIPLPGGIGISGPIVGSIHTHDADGVIHVESRDPKNLGDFFRVWGEPFGSDRIMSYVANATHGLTMTVDGQPNFEFDRLILRDGQAIAVAFGPR